jgi:hypothetical protein
MSAETKHGGAVDVLATLDLFIATYVDGQIPESDQVAIRKARAAVAELIKAAKNVVDAADPKHVGSVEYRLMEALARVGGAS